MGSSLRSIFGRAPLAIPPPVVCFVWPGGIIPIFPIFDWEKISQTKAYTSGYMIATEISMKLQYPEGKPSSVVIYRGRFYNPGALPPQPFDPITGDPLPMPVPPIRSIAFRWNLPRRIVFLTRRYDDTVYVQVSQSGKVWANKYARLNQQTQEG